LSVSSVRPAKTPSLEFESGSKPAAALVIACAAAYWSWQQFELARLSAERQQRAYLTYVSAGAYYVEEGQWPRTTVWLKNFGQTPARNVKTQQSITVSKSPRVPPTMVVYQTQPDYRANIPPWGESLLDNTIGRTLSTEELEGIKTGELAIYLDVLVTYEDAFHIPRKTKLSFHRNGQINDEYSMANRGEGDVFE
jgi:hypothetical protein